MSYEFISKVVSFQTTFVLFQIWNYREKARNFVVEIVNNQLNRLTSKTKALWTRRNLLSHYSFS